MRKPSGSTWTRWTGWFLRPLCRILGVIPISKGASRDALAEAVEALHEGHMVAIFPEGQITRDGALLPPKYGLLQFLAGVEADPDFKRPLAFVPVGVNYDWVIEDHNLVAEAEGRAAKRGFWKRFQTIVTGPFMFLGILTVPTKSSKG